MQRYVDQEPFSPTEEEFRNRKAEKAKVLQHISEIFKRDGHFTDENGVIRNKTTNTNYVYEESIPYIDSIDGIPVFNRMVAQMAREAMELLKENKIEEIENILDKLKSTFARGPLGEKLTEYLSAHLERSRIRRERAIRHSKPFPSENFKIPEFDLTNPEEVRQLLLEFLPENLINQLQDETLDSLPKDILSQIEEYLGMKKSIINELALELLARLSANQNRSS